jgi:hypothetical protein
MEIISFPPKIRFFEFVKPIGQGNYGSVGLYKKKDESMCAIKLEPKKGWGGLLLNESLKLKELTNKGIKYIP